MNKTMKGLVYGGPGKIELKEMPVPKIEKPADALVKIIKTTICVSNAIKSSIVRENRSYQINNASFQTGRDS